MSAPPQPVLARYAPALDGLRWVPVGGGFSGATVWRGDDPAGNPVLALKSWPPEVTPPRLSQIHAWVRSVAHMPFVPAVLPTADGHTWVNDAGRLWDVGRWMPGTPRPNASRTDVEAACAAVARLHAAWPVGRHAPCPGVLARLRALADFRAHFGSAPGFQPSPSPALGPLLRRARTTVAAAMPTVERALRQWEAVPLPLRPCVRDLRGEHVLFSDATVTGIVDYGAMAVDHPAVDLARLLGDLAGEDEEHFAAGLRAYGCAVAGDQLDVPQDLARVLDRSGAVCSVVGWLVRLLVEGRTYPDESAVAARLGGLVDRVARFPVR